MKRLALALLAAALAAPAIAHADDRAYVVVLKAPSAGTRVARDLDVRPTRRYSTALDGFAVRMSDAQAGRAAQDPAVAHVVPDVIFRASAAVAPGETVPAGIRRVRAATAKTASAAGDSGVAVLDTGLDLANADLQATSAVNCIKPGTPAQDDNGHGTHVGGTLAARNSGSGVTGVAPGTRLYAVKVLDSRARGTLSQLLCGLDWVAKNAPPLGVRVANMSIEASGRDDGDCGRKAGDAFHMAICTAVGAGVTFVVAAGNSRADLAATVPAAYREVLPVTATADTDGLPGGRGPAACVKTERDDAPWTSSNYAVRTADAQRVLAAPGVCVVSTRRGGGTATMTGTSMAAPHVAGAVALCVGAGGAAGPCAGLAPSDVMARVRADAAASAQAGWGFGGDPLRPIAGRAYGYLASAAPYVR